MDALKRYDMGRPVRIERKKALGMEEVVQMYLKSMGLEAPLNTRRVFAAWDQASGAAAYTANRFYKAGTLYVTLTSSAARSTLSFQKAELITRINEILATDELFSKDNPKVSFVKELKLK